jgi:SAM-dependent methyltransferase
MDFGPFDKRRYPLVPPAAGYAEWAPRYEATVAAGLDAPLWPRLRSLAWDRIGRAADLACGTGRTGAALAARGVGAIDGVDATAAMLAIAAEKGIYRSLACADVARTGLPGESYELCTMGLADEHLAALGPVYREAARLLVPGGAFLLIGYHPFFAMGGGMPTHYHREDGAAVAIETHIHLFSDHFAAGRAAGLALAEFEECVIDEAWLETKPKWRPYLHWPVSFALLWRKVDPPARAL